MYKKEITYTDYAGVEHKNEPVYFNISKSELAKMELYTPGGFEGYVRKMIETTDVPELAKLLERFILMSYGEKSADNKSFIKNVQPGEEIGELAKKFRETAAYDAFFIDLITDDENGKTATQKISEFINSVVPDDVAKAAESEEVQSKVVKLKDKYGLDDK